MFGYLFRPRSNHYGRLIMIPISVFQLLSTLACLLHQNVHGTATTMIRIMLCLDFLGAISSVFTSNSLGILLSGIVWENFNFESLWCSVSWLFEKHPLATRFSAASGF